MHKMKKKLFILCMLLILSLNISGYSQSFCFSPTTAKATSSTTVSTSTTTQSCKLYWIRVYIHRINGATGNGYTSSINNIIISNLNESFKNYGMFFTLSGSRDWNDNTYGNPSTPKESLASIETSPNNNFQTNAINIYVLPSNSDMKAGFVPAGNKKMLIIGGIRPVTHCQPNTTINYEMSTGRVIAHEMGHCFGLIHTFQNNGDDGLSDTPKDYVNNQYCIDVSLINGIPKCTFNPCSNCGISSNPTTSMTNFMSYTTPNCMSVFSPMQVNLMRYTLNNSHSNVVSQIQTTPNLQAMTRDGSVTVSTVNSITSGYHTIASNLDPNTLIANMTWTPNTSSVWWGMSGTKNTNAWIQPNAGQSVMFNIGAKNVCGTSTRNVTFTVQSAYKIYSTANISNQMIIEFDNVTYLESLPQTITISDEKGAKHEKTIEMKDIFNKKQFVNENQLIIDVKKLKRGVKIVRFDYVKSTEKNANDSESKTERVIFVD